jgi:hypothetical protein
MAATTNLLIVEVLLFLIDRIPSSATRSPSARRALCASTGMGSATAAGGAVGAMAYVILADGPCPSTVVAAHSRTAATSNRESLDINTPLFLTYIVIKTLYTLRL